MTINEGDLIVAWKAIQHAVQHGVSDRPYVSWAMQQIEKVLDERICILARLHLPDHGPNDLESDINTMIHNYENMLIP